MAKELLIETMPVAFQILEESSPKNGGRMKVKGIFTVADEVNGNGRVYPEQIVDREIEKLRPIMEDNRLFSEADHPEDGKSRISNTAALLTNIEKKVVDERKVYYGEATILNTSKGRDLQEVIRVGKPGFSSRGFGSLMKGNWKGKSADIVQEDYSMKTFDFVIGQSTKDAEVTSFTEQLNVINLMEAGLSENDQHGSAETKKRKGGVTMEIKTVEELRKAYPELVLQVETAAVSAKEKEITERIQKEFDGKVLKEVASKRDEIKNEVIDEIKKSDEFVGMVGTFVEIQKMIKPYVGEAGSGEDDSDDVEERLEAMNTEIEEMKAENKSLKEQVENDKKSIGEKEKVSAKIKELCAGKPHEALITEQLSSCKTVDDVVTKHAEVEKIIIAAAGKGSVVPGGKGKTLNEDKETEETEEEKAKKTRQRQLAGVDEDVARNKKP